MTDEAEIRARLEAATSADADWWPRQLAMADLIANAPTDIARLITALEAAEAENGRLRDMITAAVADADNAGEVNYEEDNYAAGAQYIAAILAKATDTTKGQTT